MTNSERSYAGKGSPGVAEFLITEFIRLLGALLDRLTRTCHILEYAAESYRCRRSQARHDRPEGEE